MTEIDERSATSATRRGVLAAGVGVAAAVASVATARSARAADGDPVLMGQINEGVNTTTLKTKETSLYAVSDTDGPSLAGESLSNDGYGLQGTSPYIGVNAVGGELGVYTISDYGTAVRALTYDRTAVASPTAVPQGYALRVQGAVAFSRSGRATVPAGSDRVTVSLADVRPGTSILATLQQYRPGVSVEAAVPNAGAKTVLLVLSKRVNVATPVAWLALD
jgi:hypothetical protein